jgi:CRISPR/Cas system-associated protein Cas10 (large subunit of type III CRISPR-Cas system)
MSKTHRGKGIRDQYAHGRGECVVCKRKSVKILYEQDAGDKKVKICKICRAAIKNGTKKLDIAVAPSATEASAS